MTQTEFTSELAFEPPGPGSWAQDRVHLPRPVTRYFAETHPQSCKRGAHDMALFYGMLIDGLEMAYVNGFAYTKIEPAPEELIPTALPACGRGLQAGSGASRCASGTRRASRIRSRPTASYSRLTPTPFLTRIWRSI